LQLGKTSILNDILDDLTQVAVVACAL